MVRIRLKRMGRRNRPFYRINAVDKRGKRDGRVIENLGWYDPVAKDKDKQVSLREERIKHWLGHGAVPSETVGDLLAKAAIIDADKWADARRKRTQKKHDATIKAKEEAARAEEEAKKAEAAKAKADAEAAAAAAAETPAADAGDAEKTDES